jgi:arylsulfatase A-like enzyme
MRNPIFFSFPIALAIFLANTGQSQNRELADLPNVLIIMADDLGYSDLGCYGGELATPTLDLLAKKGLRYSSFYTSARCCPSRASLLTGLHPHQTGIGSFATLKSDEDRGPAYLGHLNNSCATLAEILKSSGYSTWMVGKWHMGLPGPLDRGFDNYFGYSNFLSHSEDQWNPKPYVRLPTNATAEIVDTENAFYATDVFSEYAVEFLKQAIEQREKPWMLYLAHSSPHFPIQAPQADIDRFMPMYRKGWDVLRADRLERMKRLGLIPKDTPLPPREMVPVDNEAIANGFSGQPNPAWDSLPAERQEDLARRMATYAAMVKHLDQGVERILALLEKNHELANTLVLFMSDNGACYEWGPFGFDLESRKGATTLHKGDALAKIGQPGTYSSYGSGWANLGNTPFRLYKHFCHEGGIRSPLIAYWPKGISKGGKILDDPIHLMDIVPTVLEMTGIPYPSTFRGRSLLPLEGTSLLPTFRGERLPERALAFEHQSARGLRRGEWKIAWGKRMTTEPRWELYNLAKDVTEQKDVAKDNPDVVKQLSQAWWNWAKRVGVYQYYDSEPQP